MIDSSLTYIILRIIHIVGFTLGFASSFAILLLFLIIRKSNNLLDIFKILRLIIVIQILTNFISAISGVLRINFSTVLVNPSKTTLFYPKMLIFAVSFCTILIVFFWISNLIGVLKEQKYRNNHLNKNQEVISLLLFCLNIIFLSSTFLLGGLLSIQ